ncbi:MAG: glycosyltransferase family 4 protein [Thermotogaceae bacterium]|nr:glycosyltransferase family 4 protein [Thermotogaceae bacterium]
MEVRIVLKTRLDKNGCSKYGESKMRIAINTLSIAPTRGGAKTYLTSLVRHLAKMDQENDYFLFVTPLNDTLFEGLGENFKKIRLFLWSDNRAMRLFLEQFAIPYYVRKYKIDVLFSPGNVGTLFPRCKQVIVVHGPLTVRALRQQYAPKEVPRIFSLFYDIMLPLSLKSAQKVIVVSQSMKEWLLRQVSVTDLKIRVVYEGVDLSLFSPRAEGKRVSIGRPYILFLSTLFRYKNADKVIQAFGLVKRHYSIPHELVIGGRDPGGRVAELKRLSEKQGVADSVRFLGQVPFELVPDLYKHADIFLYPSTLESFGLPPLEAMACGTPVIGSNRCSVPEVIGDAGLIVDPDNIKEMGEAIYRLLNDQKLRNRLIQKGFERVKMFTWERAARETLQVFKEVYQEEHSK